MRKTVRITLTLALLLCASQAWAGSHGNGADQRRAAAGLPPAPSASASAGDKQDFETAQSCKSRPKLMMPTQACQQAMGRHPEFFPSSATAH